MSKHTPGPWRGAAVSHNDKMALVGSNFDASAEETKNDGMWIAQCIGPDREANARLIAAAPDLLIALEEIAVHPGPNADESAWYRVDIARTAIAKAIGEP